MIYTSSKSLQHLTVAMFTVFKNITIVCIALGEQRIFKSSITRLMWVSFVLIVLSPLLPLWLSRPIPMAAVDSELARGSPQ